MNPGIGNALSAIGRIQGRIHELQSRFAGEGFGDAMDRAGGVVKSQVSGPPGDGPGAAAKGLAGPAGQPGLGPLGDAGAPAKSARSFARGAPAGGASPRGSAAYKDLIADAAERHGIDPALVRAVVSAESGGNPAATSPVGAMGLMQLMPGTARDLGVEDPYDPAQNIEGGTKYLAALTKQFGLEQGVAAYNAGPGAVQKYGGVPPYRETQTYVDRVMRHYGAFSKETR